MGLVFKALDHALGRTVALKLVPPSVAGQARTLERFKRELLLAQRVTHPNVCRVYDLGEVEGIRFISMEYIDGQSLTDWIQAVGSLSPRQTVTVARQICSGLTAIHEQNIVHRDLKPSNIMLARSGHAVVMDFGLAYQEAADRLTAAGEVLGTLAYLSPEQAAGKTLDPRSDLYSLGLILFEMLTGRRPPGDSGRIPLALRDKDERCPPPSQFSPEVPPSLDALVLRALERDPDDRFQSAKDLSTALERVEFDRAPAAEPSGGDRRPRRQRWALAVASVALLAAVFLGLLLFRSSPPPGGARPGLAVLPLRYEGPGEQAYLAPLLSFLVSEDLRGSRGLEVVAFASSRSFAPLEDARDVARQLEVPWVLRGTLRVRGTRFEVELELESESGQPGWSRRAEGEVKELPAASGQLSSEIARALGTKLAVASIDTRHDPEALERYLEGKRFLEGWDAEQNHTRAAEAFAKALEHEANFAEARAGLALSLWARYDVSREPDLVERAFEQARLAVAGDPSLPEAHLALGVVELGRGQSAEAAASFERALAMAPGDDAVCRRIGDAYANLGREADAERMYQRAIDLRPAYWENHNRKAVFYLRRGNLAEAKALFREVIRLRPESDTGYSNLAAAHILSGELEAAEPLLRAALRIQPSAHAHNNLGFVCYSRGRFAEAAAEFQKATQASPGYPTPWGNLGDSYRQLEKREEARAAYTRAVELAEARVRVNPEDAESRAFLASALAGLARCSESAEEARRASTQQPGNGRVHYLAAVASMLCGDRSSAVRHAGEAVRRGFLVDVRTNPDLKPLQKDPAIQALLR
jgi:serine/threonine-protein kinase